MDIQPKARPTITCGPSLTEQSHKESCSMQFILKKYAKTGVIEHTNQYQGQYMDLPGEMDLHQAQNIIATANSMFETLPAVIRADFENDAGKFLAFMQEPDNKDQIEAYGLSSSHLPIEEDYDDPVPNHTRVHKNGPEAQDEPSTPTGTEHQASD